MNLKKLAIISMTALVMLVIVRLSIQVYATETIRYDGNGLLAGGLLLGDNDNTAWLLNTKAAQEQNISRPRNIYWDGGTGGRTLFWSTPLVWCLKTGANVAKALTHEDFSRALEASAPVTYTVLFLLALLAYFGVLSRVFSGSLLYIAFFSLCLTPSVWNPWEPYNIDHHGIIGVCWAAFLVGFIQLLSSNKGYIMAGIAAGIGVWISAINMIPFICIAFVALFSAKFILKQQYPYAPSNIRKWGIIAALSAFFAYMLEFAPHLPSIRFEVNNPFYIFSFFVFSQLAAAILDEKALMRTRISYGLVAGLTLFVAGLTTIKYHAIYSMSPIMNRLLDTVAECQPVDVSFLGIQGYFLVGIITLLVLNRGRTPTTLITATICLFIAAATLSAGRNFPLFVISLQILLGLIAHASQGEQRKVILCAMSLIIAINCAQILRTLNHDRKFGILNQRASQNILRQVSIDIKKEYTDGVICVTPSDGPPIAYFTGAPVQAAFYWESEENIENVYKFLTTKDKNLAKAMAKQFNFSYVVIPKNMDAPNYTIEGTKGLYPDPDRFGEGLLQNHIPDWLSPVQSSQSEYKIFKVQRTKL